MVFFIKQSGIKSSVTDRASQASVSKYSFQLLRMKVLPLSMALALNTAPVFAELPVPAANFVHAGDASYLFNDTNLTINQRSDRAILNWQNFNIGAGNSVTFKQPDSSSIALNRIFQNDPSRILGTINANGQIYLYNQNGFIFGKGVRFNANNIVATTLDVDDNLFMQRSILNAIENNQPAFFDTTGNNIGKIEVKEGAEITAESIFMIAPDIINEGTLNSADGQTILAASKDKVYLAASDKDSNLRGLLVEVGTGGNVTNAAAGNINAERGNVTLIGYAVNQNGRIRATTSIDKNGSIRLLARDQAETFENIGNNFSNNKESIGVDEEPTAGFLALSQRSGQVILGEGSRTEIAVDNDTVTKVVDAQRQLKSKVEVVGEQIWLKADSKIIAASGEVKITATTSPNNPLANGSKRNDSYIYMDEDSVIDVSGTDTAILAMERNSVAVEVRANELADSPLQRDSVLQGQTVYVDLRKGTELVNYSGAVATIEKTLAERLSAGGSINIRSEGDFVQRDGAMLNISGGKVTYNDGFINESRLISKGQVVNISDADKFRPYDGILGVNTKTHNRWAITESFSSNSHLANGRFVNGFEEGKAAGNINITAAATLLSANGVKAETTLGPYQTETELLPGTGELNVNLAYFTDSSQAVNFVLASLLDQVTQGAIIAPDTNDLQRDNVTRNLVLPDNFLKNNGLGKLTLNTHNEVVIDRLATLEARAGSEINLTGSTVTLNGNIIDHAGRVNLSAVPVNNGERANLVVAENAQIDVSGDWINNSGFTDNTLDVPEFVDGGAINLSAEGDVSIGKGALLNASAGAILDKSYDLSAGKGGDISLVARHQSGSALKLNGSLSSYALTTGGTLHLEAASVLVSNDAGKVADRNQLKLNSQFFESGGFSRYEVTANAGDLVIDTALTPIMQNLSFNDPLASGSNPRASGLPLIATGRTVSDITHVITRLDFERQAVDLDFSLQQSVAIADYNLSLTQQAAINLDPGAQLSLNSDTRIFFGGQINAPGADVKFAINTPTREIGFLADQAIWIASGSDINVASTAVYENNDQNLRIGKIFDAGSVSFEANRGYVIIEEAANIDVSAKIETLDVLVKNTPNGPKFQTTDIAPEAGQINITAAEGVVIDGELIANAASAVGAKGGEFSLTLNTNIRNILDAGQFDFSARNIIIADTVGKRLNETTHFGDAIDSRLQGTAYLDLGNIETSGFDTLKLKTNHVVTSQTAAASEIRFESDVDVSFKNSITLSAPTINSNDFNVKLEAAYIALGSSVRSRNSVSTSPLMGNNRFNANAALIDITGDVNITGTSVVNLNASDDLRFIGAITTQTPEQLTGGLTTAADINLTAKQIYPATYSQVSIDLLNNASGAITIMGQGDATPVLSALGNIAFNAPNIVQGGTIKAPLGTISLNANETISLLPGSVTSVSADDQIIPFGKTFNAGGNWIYTITTPVNVELADKSIELNAPNIDLQNNSVVDISGGGDLVAYEFVSGPTGSRDVLLAENAVDAFVILPSSNNQYAPYDFLASNDISHVGKQVYLEAGNDFSAGYYTILPARYALLPGAKLVTPIDTTQAIFPGETFARADGAAILAGKYAIANTGVIDSTYSAFVVEDGAVARTRSEYIETFANQFFAQRLPEDAGSLVINTADSLNLAGVIRGEHAEGAKGSRVDILANNIEVIDAGSDVKNDGFIQLADDNLNELTVDSLILGGKRRINDTQTNIAVQSGSVIIRDNASLELPEILLVAKNTIEMSPGSRLNGKGGAVRNQFNNYVLDNSAAILGVTVNDLPVISRTGSGVGASINLVDGSTLIADHSIFINSINDVALKANLLLDGGNLSLGAKNISLGAASKNISGLNLSSELIESLRVDQLEISSIESITINDDIDLAFNRLSIIAPGINGKSAAGVNVQLTASGDVVLQQNGFSAAADGQGAGSFKINAKNIRFAGNEQAFLFDGFNDVQFSASQHITGSGYANGNDKTINNAFDFGAANLVFDTPLFTGEAGSSLILNSLSRIVLLNSAGKVSEPINALGSTFIVNASDVVVDTNIVFPSGLVALNAHGIDNNNNVTLTTKAVVDTSGRTINYVDGSQAGSSGGLISLLSDSGDVVIESGSIVNISGSDFAGDSGTLNLSAINGTAVINEKIKTVRVDGFSGGAIFIDVGEITDLPVFMQQLQSSDFSQRQAIRLRNGDITIPLRPNNEATIKANEIILTADDGAITLNGKLDASGKKAGRINIYASGDINASGAIFDVFATDSAKGGKVLLATSNGQLSVDSDTQINVSGNINATRFDSGKVTLRAPRFNNNSDVAITNIDGDVIGAEKINIEGFTAYNDAVIGNTQQSVYRNAAALWLANKNNISTRLDVAADNRVHFLAGVEVFNEADITITNAIDFYQWQLDSTDVIKEGTLTIRAANNLNINASISDAISDEVIYSVETGGSVFDGPVAPVIKNGESWNYRLVSGADLNSANVLVATPLNDLTTSKNLVLAANVAVRTGKSDIDIASGGDLILADQTAVIYTVGQGNGTGRFEAATIDFGAIPDGPQFPDQGGDIHIDVAGDINSAISDQFFTDWLQRYGGVTQLDKGNPIPGLWAIVINDFQQGIATLGGGNIEVVAGGNISNVSISTPQNGQIDANNKVIVRGGGDIILKAGGDINSARLLADGGEAIVRARGNITSDNNGLNMLIALGDAQVNIEAGGNIGIEGIGNVTMLPLSTLQSNSFIELNNNSKNTAYFFSYTERSAVNLLSYYGDITLNNDIEAIKITPSNRFTGSSLFPWSVYPGEFSAATLSGDIAINRSFTLFPNADGNLILQSAKNIVSRQENTSQQVFVSVSDVAISALPSINDPQNSLVEIALTEARLKGGTTDQSLLHDFNRPLHLTDNDPLSIVANNNITANGELKLRSPKQVQVIAGNNISDVGFEIQNIRPTDKSIIMAGGDITYSLPDTGSTIVSEGVRVTGPGSITVMAGGDIRLGISKGIRSLGSVDNFILPKQGADISVFAGVVNAGLNDELNTQNFISTYFKGEFTDDVALIDIDIAGYQQQLVDYVLSDRYNGDLTQPVAGVTLQSYANNDEAAAAFKTLDPAQQIDVAINSFSRSNVSEQRKLIIDVFTAELKLAAENVAATTDENEYARGFLAINKLFSADETGLAIATALENLEGGDISLPFSRIQSTAGGDINILAPHGELNVGFTAEVKNASSNAGSLGVVISGQGDLSAMTDGNINVNLSRVQALDGGDITLWSSNGNIDAGRGAKTALTIPPPLTVVNKDTGQIEIIFPPAVTGSGINAGVSSKDLKPGRVTLAAPGGVVNASDGGIGSAGDLVVAAAQVLGGDNFSAGGATVGVPIATNVTAGLSGLSGSTDNAVSRATDAAALGAANAVGNDAGIAVVTVELLAPEDDF